MSWVFQAGPLGALMFGITPNVFGCLASPPGVRHGVLSEHVRRSFSLSLRFSDFPRSRILHAGSFASLVPEGFSCLLPHRPLSAMECSANPGAGFSPRIVDFGGCFVFPRWFSGFVHAGSLKSVVLGCSRRFWKLGHLVVQRRISTWVRGARPHT